ncbi:hypothetical protein HOY82DRAFT_526873 [Tuber indicum]|nr:hypothetical protein HOY82DRAFT_526873 [Tuber indicum]
MCSKEGRGTRGERRTSDICITCEKLVSRERLRAQYEPVPITSRFLGLRIYEVLCVEMHNRCPGHGMMDFNMPSSLVNL